MKYDRKDEGKTYTSPFEGVTGDWETFVPTWLEKEIDDYFRSTGNPWEFLDQLNYDLFISFAPHLHSRGDFETLIKVMYEVCDKNEFLEAINKYAGDVHNRFKQAQEERRKESSCILCRSRDRFADSDICNVCRKEHYQEEQHVRIHLYRARKAGTPATLTLGQWIHTLKKYNYLCAYCTTKPYEVLEHFIPISSGGGTTEENCVPACRSCNVKKRDEHPER